MPHTTILRKLVAMPIVFLVILGLFASAVPAVAKERKDMKFRIAFGALRGTVAAPKVEPVAASTVLGSGDKIKVMIELQKKCFVYLIHYNSQGDVTMLFPYSVKQFDTDYQTGHRYYVPKGDAWFQLDDKTGWETFYLIASDQRLLDVEFIYDKYVSAEPAKKTDLAGRMLAELDGLRGQYQAAVEPGDLLASNGGPARGFERATGADPTDIAGLAREVAFNNLYSETFVIEHR